MSTRVSLSYGPNYHFYEEMFDRSNVYLRVEGHEYEVTNDKVTIQIPIEVWRNILIDWSSRGWPIEEDNKSVELQSEWVESFEQLVKSINKEDKNES